MYHYPVVCLIGLHEPHIQSFFLAVFLALAKDQIVCLAFPCLQYPKRCNNLGRTITFDVLLIALLSLVTEEHGPTGDSRIKPYVAINFPLRQLLPSLSYSQLHCLRSLQK